MKREEQIEQAKLEAFPLPPLYNEEQRRSKEYAESWARARDQQWGFQMGAMWSDENPREGLWNKDKVLEWIKKHYTEYAHNQLGLEYIINDLCKAMEG